MQLERSNEGKADAQGDNDMLSVPPVRTTCDSPSLISCAALKIDWKPLPQSLCKQTHQDRTGRQTVLSLAKAGTLASRRTC